MSETITELPSEVRAVVQPKAVRVVADRRGSIVWEAESEPHGRVAVKVGAPIDEQRGYTALAPAREASVLHALGRPHVAYGTWDRGTWSVQPWFDGLSLWPLWGDQRKDRQASIDYRTAADCAEALDRLHSDGWVHGDVQPAHLIVSDGVRLIDLAFARGGKVPALYDFPYPGCLVHYEAPEISRNVLATGTATPSPAADVYALGASLLICATSVRAMEYPDDAEREEQRQAVVDNKRRPFDLPEPFGGVVDRMLSYEPYDRPTLAEVMADFREAAK
ncbi:protein kinase [Streptomyces sp. NPDC059009]|uniref:protein kinase domain-containing protein n=1 Tax=Streptomyces sp. NPDC059009 TaxID=3346694 RepID=UPI003687CB0E